VTVFDKLNYGGEALLPFHRHERFKLLRGDVRGRNAVDAALAGIDAVVHFATVVGQAGSAGRNAAPAEPDRGGSQISRKSVRPYSAAILSLALYSLYINGFDRQMNLNPCCYMVQVRGHQMSYLRQGASFDDVWNSPAMIALRKSLNNGPLMQPCLKCAFYW
jgi:hypothetical protein